MHALVVSLSTEDLGGLSSHHVYIFDSELSAINCALDALVAARELLHENNEYIWPDRQERWSDAKEALEAYQDVLGASEYLHVFEATALSPVSKPQS